MIDEIPKHNIVIVMRDLNAKVGGTKEKIGEAFGPLTTIE